ncbi:MAG: TMEM175 family protein [Pseudomonadota bacterium]
MLREFVGRQLDHDPNFRWRGESVTRIENLSDIAFALSLGMLISGANAPSNFSELRAFLFYLLPAAASFGVILKIWTAHFTFFRRYGVADRTIIFLNSLLIFVVLYLAYPLRFTFDALYAWIIGEITQNYSRAIEIGMNDANAALTISFFVGGYGICMALLALKYEHVVRRKSTLELDDYELAKTRATRAELWLGAVLAFPAISLALFTTAGPMAAFLLTLQFPGRHLLTRHYLGKLDG